MRCYNPDEIDVVVDDERLVADAGLLLPATLAAGSRRKMTPRPCAGVGS
jgi:hypothetical protein